MRLSGHIDSVATRFRSFLRVPGNGGRILWDGPNVK